MDLSKYNLLEDILMITNDDGVVDFISEDIANDEEKAIIQEFRKQYPNGKPLIVSLDDAKASKIEEISSTCEDKIINEFYSSCLGVKKKFDCEIKDQTNIIGLVAKAQMILANLSTDTSLDWKASGEAVCYPWTPEQILTLGMDLFSHKTAMIKKFELLREYINKQTDVEIVQAITWETQTS